MNKKINCMEKMKFNNDNQVCGTCGENYRDCECSTGPNRD